MSSICTGFYRAKWTSSKANRCVKWIPFSSGGFATDICIKAVTDNYIMVQHIIYAICLLAIMTAYFIKTNLDKTAVHFQSSISLFSSYFLIIARQIDANICVWCYQHFTITPIA